MNNKQRVHAALEGKPVDRCPVTSLYNFLYQLDHFSELTGWPAWRMSEWLAMAPEAHVELYARMQAAAPFELLLRLQRDGDLVSRVFEVRRTIEIDVAAKAMQLMIEYDPQPPFDAGHLDKAGDAVVQRVIEYAALKN